MSNLLCQKSTSEDYDGDFNQSLLPKKKERLTETRIAAASALLYTVVLGMLVSYTAPATADMKRPGSTFQGITDDQISWIGSLLNLGCLFGNLLAGLISQNFGRKSMLISSSIFYVTSWLMVAYAPSMAFLYAGRFIGGVCAGSCQVATSVYIVEIAPTKIRGQLATGFQIAFTVGVLFVMSLGIFLTWSWLAVSGAVVITCATWCMFFMPESPPWLLRNSRIGEAEKELQFLKGKDFDFRKEIKDMMEDISQHQQGRIKLIEFLEPEIYKPTSIAVVLMFCQQASGISPLLAYTVEIFQTAGSTINPSIAATVVALVQVIGTVFSGYLMDRSGRKCLFITSNSCMFISLFALGTYSYVIKQYDVDLLIWGYIPLISFVMFIFSFSLGSGPIPYVMIPEMIPIKFRSIVVAIAGVWVSLLSFLSSKTFHSLKTILGDYGLYWAFSSLTFLSAVFGHFVLPETKGLTMHQISRSFSIPNDII